MAKVAYTVVSIEEKRIENLLQNKIKSQNRILFFCPFTRPQIRTIDSSLSFV